MAECRTDWELDVDVQEDGSAVEVEDLEEEGVAGALASEAAPHRGPTLDEEEGAYPDVPTTWTRQRLDIESSSIPHMLAHGARLL